MVGFKCKKGYKVEALRSGAGWYIGTLDPEDGCPMCRISRQYFKTEELAVKAIKEGFEIRNAMENEMCCGGMF